MKNNTSFKFQLTTLFSIALLAFTSCAPQIQLTSSWTNKQAVVKPSPMIMVMVIGKDLATRQSVESYMVSDLQKAGQKAIGSLDIFKPGAQKMDSATMVSVLRQNNIDMLLLSAVTNVSEKERYIPGTTEQVPTGTYATPYNPYYYNNSYYNNYYGSNYYYQTTYETRTTPGYTVIDVEVIIESRLFDVANSEMLWFGQSKSQTKEPTTELIQAFSRMVIDDIKKNNIIKK